MGAFLLVGPFGPVLTKSYNFARLLQESQGGKRGHHKTRLGLEGKKRHRHAALTSKKQRIAMKGKLNLINERFVDEAAIAVLDKRGCAIYSEKVHGPFRHPQIDKEKIFESIAIFLYRILCNFGNSSKMKSARYFVSRQFVVAVEQKLDFEVSVYPSKNRRFDSAYPIHFPDLSLSRNFHNQQQRQGQGYCG